MRHSGPTHSPLSAGDSTGDEAHGAPSGHHPAAPADPPDPADPAAPAGPADRQGHGLASPGGPVPHTTSDGPAQRSDAALTQDLRAGDPFTGQAALDELYRRHHPAVLAYARTCCRDPHTAEDLGSEAFARTLQAVRAGGGPTEAWRPYLLTAVRRTAAAWSETARRTELAPDFDRWLSETPAEAHTARGAHGAEESAEERMLRREDGRLALRAFRALPERWQAVLWHSLIEEEPATATATQLGLSTSGLASLTARAREGLREAYLAAYAERTSRASGPEADACRRYATALAASVRRPRSRAGRRAGRRAAGDLERHLAECPACGQAARELTEINDSLRGVLPAAVLLWAGGAYLAKTAGGATAAATASATAATDATTAANVAAEAATAGKSAAVSGAAAHTAGHAAGTGAGASGAGAGASGFGAGTSGAGAGSLGGGAAATASGAASTTAGIKIGAGVGASLLALAVGGFVFFPDGQDEPRAAAPRHTPATYAPPTGTRPTPTPAKSSPPPSPSRTQTERKPSRPPAQPADARTRLRIASTGRCMDIADAAGSAPHEAPCTGAASQQWDLLLNKPGQEAQLRNRATGLCLVHTGTETDGAPVHQQSCASENRTARWTYFPQDDGTMAFAQQGSRLYFLGLDAWHDAAQGKAHPSTIGTTANYYNTPSLRFRYDGDPLDR
ncbi:sigma-70 family RNA polymerase sigma factor [Streptomyces tubbatahanensis]|uniref:Sigma-70 family RNA polymerase sigma factor n=1 Tax=Streptomyces tubbatahanensis TaxID=2923272 RepID=A0ABY3XTE6_9ACTN|nr:sigma-70 family RNA polymerase sigma factor [Streptomyces tubbatahanensis]UNS97747.1 sigma-70 family RNA polymerase sigma factor [Streptomyces tubbatahanensis]